MEDKVKVENLARETHLTIEETVMWLNHLRDVKVGRLEGAKKAAATRAAKRGIEIIK